MNRAGAVLAVLAAASAGEGGEAVGEMPWRSVDVGKVSVAGRHAWSDGALTIAGAGDDVWLAGDGFRFVYVPVKGDFTITARLARLADTHAWAKVGIMARAHPVWDSRYAFVFATPGSGARAQMRLGDLEDLGGGEPADLSAPCWLKLARRGRSFETWASADGREWVRLSSREVAMGPVACAGFAACSHAPLKLCEAAFDSISVAGEISGADPAPGPAPPADPAVETALGRFGELARRARMERRTLAFPRRKKLIAFSQDPLTPRVLLERKDEMEGTGLDGAVLWLEGSKMGFAPRPLDEARLLPDYEDLIRLPHEKLTDNFILYWCTSPLDWFDEAAWRAVVHNARLFARAALLGRCAGLLFDPECYGPNVWAYGHAARRKERSFKEYRARVTRCGEEWIRAVEEELPNPRILTLFLTGCEGIAYQGRMTAEEIRKTQAEAEKGMPFNYSLLSAFMEGVLRGASDGAMIVDGNEPAYYFPFEGSHPTYAGYFRESAAIAFFSPPATEKYRKLVRLGSTFYPNFYFGLHEPGWSGADRLSPAQQRRWLEHNVYQAFRTSDEYVWEYLDLPLSRWKGELPDGYEAALKTARAKAEGGEPLGFELPGPLANRWLDWEKLDRNRRE